MMYYQMRIKVKNGIGHNNLVGKVSKEIQIPVTDADDRNYLFQTMKQGCLDYLNYNIDKNRVQSYNKIVGEGWSANY